MIQFQTTSVLSAGIFGSRLLCVLPTVLHKKRVANKEAGSLWTRRSCHEYSWAGKQKNKRQQAFSCCVLPTLFLFFPHLKKLGNAFCGLVKWPGSLRKDHLRATIKRCCWFFVFGNGAKYIFRVGCWQCPIRKKSINIRPSSNISIRSSNTCFAHAPRKMRPEIRRTTICPHRLGRKKE